MSGGAWPLDIARREASVYLGGWRRLWTNAEKRTLDGHVSTPAGYFLLSCGTVTVAVFVAVLPQASVARYVIV
jgi:hypothetical protein